MVRIALRYSDLVGLALKALAAAFAEVGKRVTLTAAGTVLAAILSLPLLLILSAAAARLHSIAVFSLGAVLVAVILPNPALAGLQFTVYELAHRRALVTVGDSWTGLRQFGLFALRVWLVSLVVTAVIVVNLVFYTRHGLVISFFMQALWTGLLILWVGIHLFVYPLIIGQERRSILLVYRNAAVMTFSRPLFLCLVVPLWLIVLAVCMGTGLIVIVGLALSASIQQHASMTLLTTFDILDAGTSGTTALKE